MASTGGGGGFGWNYRPPVISPEAAMPRYYNPQTGKYDLLQAPQNQAANLAIEQANKDLAGIGSMTEINAQGAAMADPFASQRPQYQNALANLMAGDFSINDPSYKFRFDQGQQALERSAAAKGFLGSGNVLQELQKYGQDMASQEYQNQYNRLLPLTGATTGSPGTAGTIKSGLLDWRNQALASLGAGMQLNAQPPGGGGLNFGSGSSFGSSGTGASGAGGTGGSGGGGGGISGGGGGGGGGFGTPSYGGGGAGGTGASMGYDPAYSDEMLRKQLAAGGGTWSGGEGFINAVPTGNEQSENDLFAKGIHPRSMISQVVNENGVAYGIWPDGYKQRI